MECSLFDDWQFIHFTFHWLWTTYTCGLPRLWNVRSWTNEWEKKETSWLQSIVLWPDAWKWAHLLYVRRGNKWHIFPFLFGWPTRSRESYHSSHLIDLSVLLRQEWGKSIRHQKMTMVPSIGLTAVASSLAVHSFCLQRCHWHEWMDKLSWYLSNLATLMTVDDANRGK